MGKKPLHIVYALNSTSQRKSGALKNLLGKKLSYEEIEKAKALIKESGGLESAKAKSRFHAKKADRLIRGTGLSDEIKFFFGSFIKYVEESLEWYA